MPKQREKSGEEYWRGLYREADKLNRSLKRRLRQYEKYSQDEELASDTEDTAPKNIKPVIARCSKCGEGHLSTFELIGKVFETCSSCDYRKKIS